MPSDPVQTNPDLYHVIFENERVRVLQYEDVPGDRTTPHSHPDSVMITLSSFRRRLHAGGTHRDVEIAAETAHWLPAQEHAGENIGETPTCVVFVELKETSQGATTAPTLGPSTTRSRAGE
jgi:quercetin dioxygenase-like cupin family protein